jgi:hypothetical protein
MTSTTELASRVLHTRTHASTGERALYTKEAPGAENMTDSAGLASRMAGAAERLQAPLNAWKREREREEGSVCVRYTREAPEAEHVTLYADFATRRDVAIELELGSRSRI